MLPEQENTDYPTKILPEHGFFSSKPSMNKKIFYTIGIVAVLIAFFWYLGGIEKNSAASQTEKASETGFSEISASINNIGAPQNSPAAAEVSAAAESLAKKIRITIIAGESSYPLSVNEGSNAYEAMEELAKVGDFQFKAKYFSSLGYQINEINGKKENAGYYWTFYINSKYSNIGASSYKLKEGDVIEWRYEKN